MSEERYFTFCLDTEAEVDDMRALWGERVVDCDRTGRRVRVQADPLAIDTFLLFYDLDLYLRASELDQPRSVHATGATGKRVGG